MCKFKSLLDDQPLLVHKLVKYKKFQMTWFELVFHMFGERNSKVSEIFVIDVIRYLIKHNAKVSFRSGVNELSGLECAFVGAQREMESDASIFIELFQAADVQKALLDFRLDKRFRLLDRPVSIVLVAAQMSKWTLLRALCQLGAEKGLDVQVNASDSDGRTALFDAPTPELVQALSKARANPRQSDSRGRTALFGAKTAELVRALVDAHVDPQQTDDSGRTALFGAKTAELVRALVDAHVGPQQTDDVGQTALFGAKTAELVRALVDAHVDPKHIDNFGKTALFGAETAEVVQALVDAHVDPKHIDNFGNTALFGAKTAEVFEALVDAHVDPSLKNSEGSTWLMSIVEHYPDRALAMLSSDRIAIVFQDFWALLRLAVDKQNHPSVAKRNIEEYQNFVSKLFAVAGPKGVDLFLRRAVSENISAVLKALCTVEGVNVCLPNALGETAVHDAQRRRDPNVLAILWPLYSMACAPKHFERVASPISIQ